MTGYSPALLVEARALAETLMTSTVRVTRVTGSARDEDTGITVPTVATLYTGKARVKFPSADSRRIDAGDQRFALQSPTLSIPISTVTEIRVDDDVEVTADADAGLVGLHLRIVGVHAQSQATARRFPVEVYSHA